MFHYKLKKFFYYFVFLLFLSRLTSVAKAEVINISNLEQYEKVCRFLVNAYQNKLKEAVIKKENTNKFKSGLELLNNCELSTVEKDSIFVYVDDGIPLAIIDVDSPNKDNEVEISVLIENPERTGFAKYLIEFVINKYSTSNVYLEPMSGSENFYISLGFRPIYDDDGDIEMFEIGPFTGPNAKPLPAQWSKKNNLFFVTPSILPQKRKRKKRSLKPSSESRTIELPPKRSPPTLPLMPPAP